MKPMFKAELDNKLTLNKAELEKLGAIPGLKEAYENRLVRSYFEGKAMNGRRALLWDKSRLAHERESIFAKSGMALGGEPRGADSIRLEKVKEEMRKAEKELSDFDEYTEGSNLSRLAELKRYTTAYNNDRLMPVPTTVAIEGWAMEKLRQHKHIALVGHLGSGKTAVAKDLAKRVMLEQGLGGEEARVNTQAAYDNLDVEIFSASYEASMYDLIGKLKLKVKEPMTLDRALKELDEAEPEIASYEDGHDIKVSRADLLAHLTGRSDSVETIPEYGPLARALEKGVTCVIDEFNRMRSEVLALLNDLMLAKVGDKVRLQVIGQEEFEIKPGFVLILTANLGEQYKSLQDVDAAAAGRWRSRVVDYPAVDETYDMILAGLLNKDRLRLPYNFPANQYGRLADLAVTAREVQEIFSGKTVGKSFAGLGSADAAPSSMTLKAAALSSRDVMDKIIGSWRASGFEKSLDEVIADNYISSQIYEPGDRKFLTEIFLRRGFFDKWNLESFKRHGIGDISQQELDTLRNDEIKEMWHKSDEFAELHSQARARGRQLSRDLLVGVRDRRDNKE
jgi:MoxR-like ATPase